MKKIIKISPFVLLIVFGSLLSALNNQSKDATDLPDRTNPPVITTERLVNTNKSESVFNPAGVSVKVDNYAVDQGNNSKISANNFALVSENAQIDSPYIRETVLGDSIISNGKTYPKRTYTTKQTSNDPLAGQWWEDQTGLSTAWSTVTGSSDTILAIIDTGFNLDHEDLSGRWYENYGEVGTSDVEAPSQYNCSDQNLALNKNCNLIDDNYDGIVDNEAGTTSQENPSKLNCSDQNRSLDKNCNLIDDDKNGLIDDWRGWDFVTFDSSVRPGDVNPLGQGVQHGTLVSGIAGATGNNGIGIAGVNWQTKILPLQALSDNGSGSTVGIVRAIRYAVAHGADVINLSLGSSLPDNYVRQAVQEAIESGVIVVAAAGNDGCDCMSYPANYPETLAVGALNNLGARASFSSYGAHLDVMAPGVDIATTSWTESNTTSLYALGVAGTSFATPIVSGYLTALKGAYPDASPQQLVSSMLETTNRLGLSTTTAWSSTLGFGALQADTTINRLTSVYAPAQLPGFQAISDGSWLRPSNPYEPPSNSWAYRCPEGVYGATRLYRLTTSNEVFFSVSEVEVEAAVQSGYSKTFITHVCRTLPQDFPESIRLVPLAAELLQRNPKFSE